MTEENVIDIDPVLFVKELLSSWGLSQEIQNIFEAQKIDISVLDQITESDIQELIPSTHIRDRIKFRTGLQEYQKESKSLSTASLDTESAASIFSSEDDPNSQLIKRCKSTDSIDSGSNTSLLSTDDDHSHSKQKIYKEFDLQMVLNSDSCGQLCLASLKKNERLDSAARSNLVKSVVQYFIKKFGFMTRNDFEEVSSQIVLLVPTEHKETYYIPSQKYGRGKYIPARGKLVDKYYNQKRLLRSVGLIERKYQTNSPGSSHESTSNYNEIGDDEFNELKIWLKFNREPWHDLIEKWSKTTKRRIYELRNVQNIYQEWPLYKTSIGFQLIEVDFKSIYPGQEISLFKKWPEFLHKALPLYKKIKSSEKYVRIIDETQNEDVKDYCFAILIAYKIIPNFKITLQQNNKKTSYKPSLIEAINAYILHVKNQSEIQTRLQRWREEQSSKGITCQPLIVIVGSTEETVQEFYVAYDCILYKLDSFIKALDICFKVFHVLDAKYPEQAVHIWTFIQKYFYNIDLKEDKKLTGIFTFMSELK